MSEGIPQDVDAIAHGPHLHETMIGPDMAPSLEIINGMVELGLEVPEPEKVAEALDSLRVVYGIEDKMLEDRLTSTYVIAIANRLAGIDSIEDPEVRELEAKFLDMMLTHGLDLAGKNNKVRGIAEDGVMRKTLEQFQQPELARGLKELILGPWYSDLKRRFGFEKGSDLPFDIYVPTISVASDQNIFHEVAAHAKMEGDTVANSSELTMLATEEAPAYQKAMHKRRAEFLGRLGFSEEELSSAFLYTFEDGTRILVVTSDVVEMLVNFDNPKQSDGKYQEMVDKANILLRHELGHALGESLTVGPIFGLALEEAKAVHYARGSVGTYDEVFDIFATIETITGYNPIDSFADGPDVFRADEFVFDIVRNLGLDGLLDLYSMIPKEYIPSDLGEVSPDDPLMLANGPEMIGIVSRFLRRAVNNGAHLEDIVDSAKVMDSRLQRSGISNKFMKALAYEAHLM